MNILHLPSTPIFDTINQFVNGPYGPIILWTGFIIALLNCFFGYTLNKNMGDSSWHSNWWSHWSRWEPFTFTNRSRLS